MAAIHGLSGSVKIGATSVASIDSWRVDINRDVADATNFGSNGWKESIAGLKGWGGSLSGSFDMGDTNGQLALQNALLNGTTVALKLYVDATHYYSGNAYITKIGADTPVSDKVKASFDFQGTGALAYA